jgi:uncharacterized protein
MITLTHNFRSGTMIEVVIEEPTRSAPESIEAAISPRDKPSRACCSREPTTRMIEGFEQFNRGLYWEQHETLEGVWREESDPSIRNFYKGVIQVGVGFHHLRNGNYIGVTKVLARGIVYLKPYSPECYGVDVARLREEATGVYLRTKELGPDRIGEASSGELPKIHYRHRGMM